MLTGPFQDIVGLQNYVREHFLTLNSLMMGEAGTCKKVIQLECPPLNLHYPNLALAFTHERNQLASDIIHHEHYFLRILKEKGFPVVSLHGEVFLLEEHSQGKRYGMLMDYIPHSVFVESKTPATLKLLIVASLLGITTRAQEAWVIMNRNDLLRQIKEKLSTPESFVQLNTGAHNLEGDFNKLTTLSETHALEINDLQMLLTVDGHLTIIDPLDLIVTDPHSKTLRSILKPEPLTDENFQIFLSRTRLWLQNAKQTCEMLKGAKTVDEVLTFVESTPTSTVLSFAACDAKHKSRIAHLRQGTSQKQMPFPDPNSKNLNKP
jgi:hypothetical protein